MQAIHVNGVTISPEQVFQEMQYFPAETPDLAIQAAGRSLVINELLRQRAKAHDLLLDTEEEWVDRLMALEAPFAAPSESECERYYEAHTEQFSSSPLAEARHILLAAAPDDVKARDERRAQAEALIRRLQESLEEFATLARKHSDCPSKETGGSLGQISRGQTVPEFEKALFRASPGLMDRPLETRYGVHVVFIERLLPGRPLPFVQVREQIRHYLQERSERMAIADYLARLMDEADIQGLDLTLQPLVQ